MSTIIGISRVNNFDLIRLFAAIQVLFWHTISHFGIKLNQIFDVISLFPGVPIFFTISGFLLTYSLTRNSSLKNYFINRSLRIFPALWVCLLITIILLMADGIISYFTLFSIHFIGWVVCQLTIVQFYTPDFLTIWGTETPNGSLWTISVEYQFYLILPLIVWLSNLADKRKGVLGIIGIFLISVLFSYWNFQLNHESLLSKLIHVSVFPYLPFFLNGILGFLFWPYIKRFLINKALFWVIFYLFYSYLGYNILHLYTIDYYPNIFGWIGYLILSMLVLSVAFTRVNLSYKLLRGNDISYGLYIYHMVVINYLIYNGIQKHQFLLTFMITFILAILSWKFVERPSLKLKKSTIGVNI